MEASTLVKTARLEAGLSQTELADRAGTTQSAIARLESGNANPRLRTLERVVAATGRRLATSLEPLGELPEVDEAQIGKHLQMSPAERVESFLVAYEDVRRSFAARE